MRGVSIRPVDHRRPHIRSSGARAGPCSHLAGRPPERCPWRAYVSIWARHPRPGARRRPDRQHLRRSTVDRFEPNLRIPGPTALPPSVREAGARQMINHRGPEFAAMLDRILTGMKPYFGTTADIAMITTAGTGGLEAAVVNTISP